MSLTHTKPLQEIIDWLVDFENKAARFYTIAAEYFKDDPALSKLAHEMAEDEVFHAKVIAKVSKLIDRSALQTDILELDMKSKLSIENSFQACEESFIKGAELYSTTKQRFLNSVIEAEFSEWNTYLIFAVNSLKHAQIDDDMDFHNIAKEMQHHKTRIIDYIKGLSDIECKESKELLEKVSHLPDLWTEKFLLVVDDEDNIIGLLKAILGSRGTVDSASNGKEALMKHNHHKYDVTITDVDMPVMGGIEFYEHALKLDPTLKDSIIFFTGAANDKTIEYLETNNLKYLIKPSHIGDIVKSIDEILHQG